MMPATKRPEGETVVEETINAYVVQKLKNGSVRIRAGGRVVTSPTYFEALESYAQWEQEDIEDSPDHLRPEKRESIYDGVISLYSTDTAGFTPEEILDEVTGQPLERVLDDLDDERTVEISPADMDELKREGRATVAGLDIRVVSES